MTTMPTRSARPFVSRVSCWRAPRFLRACWLAVTGRTAGVAAPSTAAPDGVCTERLRTLPRAAAVIAALEEVATRDRAGLRALLFPWARPWFDRLRQHLAHDPDHRHPDEAEWLDWAIRRHGVRALDALLRSVLRRTDPPVHARPAMDDDRPCRPAMAAAERARRSRELSWDPLHQQALMRERGRRRLVRRLTGSLVDHLREAGERLLAERAVTIPHVAAGEPVRARAGGRLAPVDRSTGHGTLSLGDVAG
ncbi:MAG: hypothetical protein H6851_11620 [Geminicoccaceae bacterium]|nr:hypothetical protein [Geminicoccaceae bacterium]